jgi:hypothetical protein
LRDGSAGEGGDVCRLVQERLQIQQDADAMIKQAQGSAVLR